jgi:hypothetical protein
MALRPHSRRTDRRLLEDPAQWSHRLVSRYVAAADADERQRVLAEAGEPLPLDEDGAIALYRVDPLGCGAFIQQHLPPGRRAGDETAPWQRLMDLAAERGDDALRFGLYRRQATPEQWQQDTAALVRDRSDAASLCAGLKQRHPQRWRPDVGPHLLALAQERGADILPYLVEHAGMVWRGQHRPGYVELLRLTRERGWWELWAALIRVGASAADYDAAVRIVTSDRSLPDTTAVHRLLQLAGVNTVSGLVSARAKPLREATILVLHERFPHLVTGPFRSQLQPAPRRPLTGVLELAMRVEDRELIDQLAVRLSLRAERSGAERLMEAVRTLTQYLKDADPEPAAQRRAAMILRRLPRRSINNQRELLARNPLARLLWERATAACIARPEVAAQLLQAEERHVCALAVDAVTGKEAGHRALDAEGLESLLQALERPLPRTVIRRALGVLEESAREPQQADSVVRWARSKLAEGHPRFSPAALLELTAHLLQRFPMLRLPAEQPVVYRRAAA